MPDRVVISTTYLHQVLAGSRVHVVRFTGPMLS
jgi:hypothetical protein